MFLNTKGIQMQNETIIERKVTANDICLSYYEKDNVLRHFFIFETDGDIETVIYNTETADSESRFFSFNNKFTSFEDAKFFLVQEFKISLLEQGAKLK